MSKMTLIKLTESLSPFYFNHPKVQFERRSPWSSLIALASKKTPVDSKRKLNKDLSALKRRVVATFVKVQLNSIDQMWGIDEIRIHDIDRVLKVQWQMKTAKCQKHVCRFSSVSMKHESFHELCVIPLSIDSTRFEYRDRG